jgi:hypothetical protein
MNDLQMDEFNTRANSYRSEACLQWFVSCVVGLLIGLIGFLVHWSIDLILDKKFDLIQGFLDQHEVSKAFGVCLNFSLT